MNNPFAKWISHDIGVDLGTANTLVYVRGRGVILNEPSVVAVNTKTGRVVAVGTDARYMIGRTPAHIEAIRPMVDGVISNFEVAEEMIAYFLRKAREGVRGTRPRIVIGVPSGVTNVERRAAKDAAYNAGAREVHIVEEPMAAAVGIRLPIFDPIGSMLVDIGGGTTDIAVISLGGIVRSKNLHIAGDKLNEDIISYVRDEFKILLGARTAEDVKIAIGSVLNAGSARESTIRGRDLVTGLPREVIITDADIREAIAVSIATLVESIKEVLESTPPEVVSDIMHRGILLVGGGALMHGMAELLTRELGIPVAVAEDPLTAVARGTGIILEEFDTFKEILIDGDDELRTR